MKKICRDCLKVNAGNRVFCTGCKSSNLGVYYSAAERRGSTRLGSDWRASHQGASPTQWRLEKKAARRKSIRSWAGIIASGSLIITLIASGYLYPDLWSSLRNFGQEVTSEASTVIEDVVSDAGFPEKERLLPSVGYDGNGEYRFLAYDKDGNPTGFFSPCEPIRYEINPKNEPEGARLQLEAAIQTMRFHTGLQFVFAGETDDVIELDADGSIAHNSPTLLINYFSNQELNDKRSTGYDHVDAVGRAGPVTERASISKDQWVATGATMALDYEHIEDDLLREKFGSPGGDETRFVMIHELGHAIGLDHVDSPFEVMFSDRSESTFTAFQDGDLEGLALAGQGPCSWDALGNPVFGIEPDELND